MMKLANVILLAAAGTLLLSADAPAAPAKTGGGPKKWIVLPSKSVPGAVAVIDAATGQSAGRGPKRFSAKGSAKGAIDAGGVTSAPFPLVQTRLEHVVLRWAPAPQASGYAVARGTAPTGPFRALGTTQVTEYTDTTGTPGTTYYYTVAATGGPRGPLTSNPVAARPLTTQTNVPVNLAPYFNVIGIQPDGWKWAGTGFDAYLYAYSPTQVPSTVAWAGDLFILGPPARPDAVSDTGQRVYLPSGSFSSLLILGSFLGTSPGASGTFTLRVTYTDGSSAALSVPMSSWRGPAKQPGEANALACRYRNTGTGGRQTVPCYVHGYKAALDPAKSVQWLDLPSTGHFRVLAMNLDSEQSVLSQGQTLTPGQYLTSPSKNCFLIQQPDGSLVLYAGAGPSSQGDALWASGYRAATGVYHTVLQDDGNLVTYSGPPEKPGGAGWASATYGHVNSYLTVTDAKTIRISSGPSRFWQKP